MLDNNFRYSQALLEVCADHKIPFIYASSAAVYGNSKQCLEDVACEHPLNVYGYSKLLFDQVVRRRLQHKKTSPIIGLRYFNVYGPYEFHKGRMGSVALHNFDEYQENGFVKLFGEYGGYLPGRQMRDFVSVNDVVNVNLYFFDHPEHSGIFNVGTGRSQPFNDVAETMVGTLMQLKGKENMPLGVMVDEGIIRYIPFPDKLRGRYQSFTQADITHLREAGYHEAFLTVQEGVKEYCQWLHARFMAEQVLLT